MPESQTDQAAEDFSQQGRTFRLELLRSMPQGIVETAYGTYAVFVAISVFGLPDVMKAIMIAAGSVGLLLSLFVVQWVRRHGITVNRAAAVLWAGSAASFLLAALSRGNATGYFVGCCLASITVAAGSPLMAQIYRKHYTNEKRGHLFSLAAFTRACIAALVGWLGGRWIESHGFPPIFLTYSVACLLMAACVSSMAPVYLRKSNSIRWFDAFRHVGENAPFRKLLVVWMLLGLGNLIGWALFVEYIANPRYGFGFDAEKTGFITSTIPMLAFILFVVPWGSIFDRLPFYHVRATVNLFFIAGILTYYVSGSFAGVCIGIALHGVARSGGNIIWSLWTTRFAPADRVLEYQSVHSFLTGVRGVLAPLIAFFAIKHLGPSWVAWSGTALILAATFLTLPELREEWRRNK